MTQINLQRTSWRGIIVEHPAEWELSVASGLDQPGKLAFADRRYTRLDVTWRPLTYKPNLDLMIEKYRRRKTTRKDEVAFSPLKGVGEDWRGVVRQADGGTFVHAGRFFAPKRWLVEATIVWPERRQQALERQILDSIATEAPDAPLRHWRAMGLDVHVGGDLELLTSDPKVGRISWTFGNRRKKRSVQLVVERMAMVDHWLLEPLADWLVKALPERSALVEKSSTTFNSHQAQRLLSEKKIGTVSALRGLRRRRLDIAWVCPTDGRLYHLACSQTRPDRGVELPQGLKVDCCVSAPVLSATAEP